MFTIRLAALTLLLAPLLPAVWSLDSELQGAFEAEGNADSECVAGECGGVLSLLQVRQKAIKDGAGDEGVGGIAGRRELGEFHAEDFALSRATPELGGTTASGLGGSRAEAPTSSGATEEPTVSGAVPDLNIFGFGRPYLATQRCYGFTGGTCTFDNCKSERNAVCDHGRCLCESACAGPDGRCYNGQKNEVIATGFTLRNAKWPKYSMYFQGASVTGQLKTTNSYSWLNLGKDKFSLFKMPGNRSRFFLGSAAYTDKVARIASTTGTAISGRGLYSTDLSGDKSPGQLALSVCYNHNRDALMFGSNDGAYWAYVHHGSWLVYALHDEKPTEGTVGLGALWEPSPAFKRSQIAMLPPC